jgi:hypothetical protein
MTRVPCAPVHLAPQRRAKETAERNARLVREREERQRKLMERDQSLAENRETSVLALSTIFDTHSEPCFGALCLSRNRCCSEFVPASVPRRTCATSTGSNSCIGGRKREKGRQEGEGCCV